ncbi:amidase signature enzyme [Meredithblackwellia eburnea MCA 4105]
MLRPQLLPQELIRTITQLNPAINAFTSIISHSDAIAAFSAFNSPRRPLEGYPVAVKDIFCTTDFPTTAASRILRDYKSPFEATVVQRLREAGAVVVGKTNMDEFGMGSENVNSHFGPTLNPSGPLGLPLATGKDLGARVAGGSSGGSAAAVAAGLCRIALASDTGGSTRLPATYCGVVGLKPSYGLLSRWGMIAYASSLDCVGIMSRNVQDARDAFDILAYHDEKDPSSVSETTRTRSASQDRWTPPADGSLQGLRIGIPLEYFPSELSPDVLPALRRVLTKLQERGATLSSVSVPSIPLSLSAYYVIASAEASSNLSRYDGVRFGFRSEKDFTHVEGEKKKPALYSATRSEGFGKEVKKRILLGTHALSAEAFDNYFLQSQRIRQLLRTEFDKVFSISSPLASLPSTSFPSQIGAVDVLLHPSSISTAPLLNVDPWSSKKDTTASYVQDILNVPASLAGLPALAVPAGRAMDGWPVGVQLVGQWGSDQLILDVGKEVERVIQLAAE